MSSGKLMQERVRRVTVLFRELGYTVVESQSTDESYAGSFTTRDGFDAELFIDADSKFLEMAYTFAFGTELANFVRERLEEILTTMYEFGCYFSLNADQEIALTAYSKIYFAGMNYYALKETVRDFREAVEAMQEILDIELEETEGVGDGDS